MAIVFKREITTLLATLSFLCGLGQASKKPITTSDFRQWGRLYVEGVSTDMRFVGYKMVYPDGVDSLFISDTKTGTRRCFPKGHWLAFGPAGHVLLQKTTDTLCLLNLTNNRQRLFTGVEQAGFSPDGSHAVVLQKRNGILGLTEISLDRFTLKWTPGISWFTVVEGRFLATGSPSALHIRPAKGSQTTIPLPPLISRVGAVGVSQDGTVCFFAENKQTGRWGLYHYNMQTGKTVHLAVPPWSDPTTPLPDALRLSPDGKKVYFRTLPPVTVAGDSLVEAWSSESPFEYPESRYRAAEGRMPQLVQWDTQSGTVWQPNDSLEDTRILSGGRYILARTPLPNDNPVLEVGRARYYLFDAVSKIKTPVFVVEASMEDNTVKPDPSGRYLAFSQGAFVSVYDLEKQKSYTITLPQQAPASMGTAVQTENLGCEGFTQDGKYLILYDRYDIWLASPKGDFFRKLTDGCAHKVRYRVERGPYAKAQEAFGFQQYSFNFNSGLVVTATTVAKATGYYRLYPSGTLETIAARESKLSGAVIGEPARKILYQEQASGLPPRIMFHDGHKEKQVFQSNAHYVKYQWPHFELISYTNKQGDSLQGILIYPVNYAPGKQYPMVTYIYEQQSQDLHQYLLPVATSAIGFSPATYFLDGYFVLLPDITFIKGQTGDAALDCVTTAVNTVVARGLADPERIGLVGHSFGGYLVNYILGHTPIFAAGVSGAGVSDPVSFYLTMNFQRRRSNNWRLESQQYRLGTTPFHDMETYLANAPIALAGHVNTPLLLWAGKEDASVDFRQSIEMHLALRRMHKPNMLLLYPGEGHILSGAAAKADLTIRTKAWLDQYLKN